MMFPTTLTDIRDRISQIDPLAYAQSRNYGNGAVTRLSPYISRGVISTRQVYQHLLSMDLPWTQIEKLVQELVWRDYWQQVWLNKGDDIDQDLRQAHVPVVHHELPKAIQFHSTHIEVVDQAIKTLYETGYMHNHMRMYVASIACNVAQSHWRQPAQWMYSHLLDGDWASNALSWQWVAGANAKKKYYANQDNINKYFDSQQKNTFLDVAYEQFPSLPIPEHLKASAPFYLETHLPKQKDLALAPDKKTLIYTYYNLDPTWKQEEDVQRVLLLEPSFFKKYPVSQTCINFALELSRNIPNIQVFTGEFQELAKSISPKYLLYKEHPTSAHYEGQEEARDWMFRVQGYFPSFFAFWKKCKKEIHK